MAANFYPDPFETLWRLYKAPPSSSKATAYKAYQKAELPPQDLLLAAVEAYLEHIGDAKQYKLHLATFLNQRRWDTLLERAQAILDAKAARLAPLDAATSLSRQTWPSEVVERLGMTPAAFDAWVAPCKLELGPPPVITAPKLMIKNYLMAKLPTKLDRALGPDWRVVVG